MPRRRLLLLPLLLACSSPPAPDGADEDAGGKEDRLGPAFVEVDPTHTSAAFRRYIGKALAALAADDSDIARLTLASIKSGRVHIDELTDLTCWDFQRALRDLAPTDLLATDWAGLHDTDSPVAAALADQLYGFMWSNRIYVSRGQTARRLAATLVHEVNHVINRSDVGYYDDMPTSAFLHEYRAFYAESTFDPGEYEGVDLVDYVIDTYALDRGAIPADILADPLTPRLLPDAAAWRERAVGEDPVNDEESCPGI